MRRLFLAAAFLALSAVPSLADNAQVKRVLEEARLMGTWGVDCEAMASSTDWEQIVVDERGVAQSIVGGDDSIWTYDIVEAERLNAGEVRLKFVPVEDPNEGEDDREPIILVYRIDGDRQMTWRSTRASGGALITDGLFADGETRSEWYQRCPKGIPVP